MKKWHIFIENSDGGVLHVQAKADEVIVTDDNDYRLAVDVTGQHENVFDVGSDAVAIIPTYRCLAILDDKYIENVEVVDDIGEN